MYSTDRYILAGQNRGKAALEYADVASAHKAASHMDGGQLDGAVLKVELSELPVRSHSRSPRPPPRARNGRDKPRSFSRSPSRSRSPPPRGGYGRRFEPARFDNNRSRGFGRRGPPPRNTYRPVSRTRSRSPVRRPGDRVVPPRRRSPSYERGGTGYRARRSRSRSYSVRSSRSRTRSVSPRSRSRSMSYSSYSRYSRSRSRSPSHGRRSLSRDYTRDSRSRSPPPRD